MPESASLKAIVAGSINTDIVGLGFSRLVNPGQVTYGDRLHIGPGGKSRNIAQMLAALTGRGTVAMLGRSCRDPIGLWRYPLEALADAGVSTEYVKVVSFEETGKYPGIALIPVDRDGNNQIYVLPGVNHDFCPADVEQASPAFEAVKENGGLLSLSLELPLATAVHLLEKASSLGIRAVLDPGGLKDGVDYAELLQHPIWLIKPNQHEAEMLTGIPVDSPDSAGRAARRLRQFGVANVLVTMGKDGAYLATDSSEKHVPAPSLPRGDIKDETGCGDQAMAALCAAVVAGENLESATEEAVLAATMQFHRAGISPVTKAELEGALGR